MRYETEKQEKSTVKITMFFDSGEWENAINKAYVATRGHYAVNGFRRGKAPRHIIELNYGKSVFYEDALNSLYTDNFYGILDKEEANFKAVGEPSLSLDNLSDEGVTLSAVVPVQPEIVLGPYTGLTVEKPEYPVTDAQVEAEVNRLLDRNSRLVDVEDGAAENGDTATIDFSGSVDGVKFDGGTAEDYDLVLGSGSFIPGFEEQVVGMRAGESRDISVRFPDDYQAEELKGKDSVFAVTVKKIRRKELPELTDDFIRDAAGADSVEAYRAETREKMEKEAAEKAENELRNNLVKAVADGVTTEIPDAMTESEMDRIVSGVEYRIGTQYGGMKLDDYLGYMGMDRKTFRENYREQAAENVKARLVADAIIKKEGITASDEETEAKIDAMAAEAGVEPDVYRKDVSDSQRQYVAEDIVIEKFYKFLEENNTLAVKTPAEETPAAAETEAE